nr:putative DNA helicase [Mycolicibacter nonchromogenicus]
MLVIAEQTGGIEVEELKREALELFGGKRMTAGIKARLGEGLKRLLRDSLLTQSNSRFVSAAPSSVGE